MRNCGLLFKFPLFIFGFYAEGRNPFCSVQRMAMIVKSKRHQSLPSVKDLGKIRVKTQFKLGQLHTKSEPYYIFEVFLILTSPIRND